MLPDVPEGCATEHLGRCDCPYCPYPPVSLKVMQQCSGIVSSTHRSEGFIQILDMVPRSGFVCKMATHVLLMGKRMEAAIVWSGSRKNLLLCCLAGSSIQQQQKEKTAVVQDQSSGQCNTVGTAAQEIKLPLCLAQPSQAVPTCRKPVGYMPIAWPGR